FRRESEKRSLFSPQRKMANKAALMSSLEDGFPLNGKGFEFEERTDRSCFLSPFQCGASTPKVVAYVHVGIMLAASLLLFIIFVIIAIANRGEVLFYVGLVGAILALIPIPFEAFAMLGLLKRKAYTCIPLIVLLCFLGVTFTGLFVFFMVLLFGADTNMQFLLVFGYGITMIYLSHVIRVLLRVRLDTLEDKERIPQPNLLR
ncbi:hypothetical protein PENTCL1PPCAC_25936, partial [Pristionchus entomophagus]